METISEKVTVKRDLNKVREQATGILEPRVL